MNDNVLQQQIEYYRARAGEYDEWFYRVGRYDHGDEWNQRWFHETETVKRALHRLGQVNTALELACGTGIWTQELLKIADSITAIDAVTEVLEINRIKMAALGRLEHIEYQQHNLFEWKPERQYDLVMFTFWLSHVPPERMSNFLQNVQSALKPGGKLFIADSRRTERAHAKDNPPGESTTQQRILKDGRSFEIVKIYHEPAVLSAQLKAAGFDGLVHTTENFFFYVTATKR